MGLYKNFAEGLYTEGGYTRKKILFAFLYTQGYPWVTGGQKKKIFKNFSFCIVLMFLLSTWLVPKRDISDKDISFATTMPDSPM